MAFYNRFPKSHTEPDSLLKFKSVHTSATCLSAQISPTFLWVIVYRKSGLRNSFFISELSLEVFFLFQGTDKLSVLCTENVQLNFKMEPPL